MAYLLSGERSGREVATLSPLTAIAGWFRVGKTSRDKRRAYRELLDMDDSRLRDMGITRQDVREALAAGDPLNRRVR